MKKKLLSLLVALVMTLGLSGTALAAQEYGLVYDATELLDGNYLSTLNSQRFEPITKEYGVELRLDVVRDLEGDTIDEYAELFYDQYEYGAGSGHDGILMMVYLTEENSSLTYHDYTFYAEGKGRDLLDLYERELRAAMESVLFNDTAWAGDLTQDQAVFEAGMDIYLGLLEPRLAGGDTPVVVAPAEPSETPAETPTETAPAEPVEVGQMVYDDAGVLTQEEIAALEASCAETAQTYSCGVYVYTVDNYTDYSSETDAYEVAKDIYQANNFGVGEEQAGVMLLLNISERDYALIAYGDTAHYAFTDYGKDVMSENFVEYFGNDDWYGGFECFASDAAEFLELAAQGTPVDVGAEEPVSWFSCIVGGVAIGMIISAVVVFIKKKGMNTAVEQKEADVYVVDGGLSLRYSTNTFIHTTVSVRDLSEDKDRGGTTIDSEGFSGKSGKF